MVPGRDLMGNTADRTHGATAYPWRNTSAPVNWFRSDYLGHSKKDLIRNLLWIIVHFEDRAPGSVIVLVSRLCRKSSELFTFFL